MSLNKLKKKIYPNIVFGSSGLIGLSIINYCLRKKIKFIFTSRSKPNYSNINWIPLNLNKRSNNFKYKKFNIGIFLSSPSFLLKNLKNKAFEREFYWLKQVINNFFFSKFIYISSSSVYYKNHPIGRIKKKCEKYLLKNKKKFNKLQIWRPFNLIGSNQKIITDHFHNVLFKKLFIEKLDKYKFRGNKNDVRGYSNVDEFVEIMFKEARKEISFKRNFGNPIGVRLIDVFNIFNREYYKINKIYFNAKFSSKYSNKNIVSKKLNNSFFSKKSSKQVITRYLMEMLNDKKD